MGLMIQALENKVVKTSISAHLNVGRQKENKMVTYKCQKCGYEMLTDSFICRKCEYQINRQKNETHGRRLVTEQNVPENPMNTTSESPYWHYAEKNGVVDEEGVFEENPYANPEVEDKSIKRAIGSKCIFCEARVLVRWDQPDPHVHDSCWSVFKGQMMREIY